MSSEVNSEYQMDHQKKKIEAAIALIAQVITARKDGTKFIPVYDRLKAELTAMSSENQRMDEIRQIAMTQRSAA